MKTHRCKGSEDGTHRFGAMIPLAAGGYGWRCVRCTQIAPLDEVFEAIGTTAWEAMEALVAKWEMEDRQAEVLDSFERMDRPA